MVAWLLKKLVAVDDLIPVGGAEKHGRVIQLNLAEHLSEVIAAMAIQHQQLVNALV